VGADVKQMGVPTLCKSGHYEECGGPIFLHHALGWDCESLWLEGLTLGFIVRGLSSCSKKQSGLAAFGVGSHRDVLVWWVGGGFGFARETRETRGLSTPKRAWWGLCWVWAFHAETSCWFCFGPFLRRGVGGFCGSLIFFLGMVAMQKGVQDIHSSVKARLFK
jgi:hypothetical protein